MRNNTLYRLMPFIIFTKFLVAKLYRRFLLLSNNLLMLWTYFENIWHPLKVFNYQQYSHKLGRRSLLIYGCFEINCLIQLSPALPTSKKRREYLKQTLFWNFTMKLSLLAERKRESTVRVNAIWEVVKVVGGKCHLGRLLHSGYLSSTTPTVVTIGEIT